MSVEYFKMKLANPIRFTFAFLGCSAMTMALAVQTVSVVFTRKDPGMAIKLFPLNGAAQEQLASEIFSSVVATGAEPNHSANLSKKVALTAYQKEPLSPEAHAILGLSQYQGVKRSRLIEIASQLDRRESSLQALVLQEHVQAQDYANSVKTLDQILRVRPARSRELFPLLLSVFVQDGAVTEFAKVLDGTSPWHKRFVNFAVTHPSALINLVELRNQIDFNDLKFDQALVRSLVQQGQIEHAYRLYIRLSSERIVFSKGESSAWASTYAPFDWRLVKDSDFRAQPGLDPSELELYVKPGHGGVFAERIVKTPEAPFNVFVAHAIVPRGLAKDVQIKLKCVSGADAFIEQKFSDSPLRVSVKEIPNGCRFIEVSLHARAWSRQSAIKGSISSFVIE